MLFSKVVSVLLLPPYVDFSLISSIYVEVSIDVYDSVGIVLNQ